MVYVYIWLIVIVLPFMHEILLVDQLYHRQIASPLPLKLYLHPAHTGQAVTCLTMHHEVDGC